MRQSLLDTVATDLIPGPVLLLSEARARRNIAHMADRAAAAGVRLRPHFKTHQSAGIGDWFRAAGVSGITVSSIEMGEYFADSGWRDITIAVPVNVRELGRIAALAQRVHLEICVDGPAAVVALAARAPWTSLAVWVEIDVDYHRTGVPADDQGQVVRLLQRLDAVAGIQAAGILTHAGNAYGMPSVDAIGVAGSDSRASMKRLRDAVLASGLRKCAISIGDTPTASIVADYSPADEIRPGNFVFYDLQQLRLGSCAEADIAVAVAAPVISVRPERNEVVVHCGAVHLSKDVIPGNPPIYGAVARLGLEGWGPLLGNTYVVSLSQEHGKIAMPESALRRTEVGDVLTIIPVHSCLTASQFDRYLTLEGEWVDTMRIWRRSSQTFPFHGLEGG